MNKRNILSIDQATYISGYSIYRNGKIRKSDIIKCKGTNHGKRYLQFYNQLNDIIERYKINEIVAEDVYKGEMKGYLRLGEIRGVLKMAAASKGLPIKFVTPSEHKENLTSNMYANKTETMNVLNELGYKFKDDNEADSISIMLSYLYKEHLPVTHPNQKAQ